MEHREDGNAGLRFVLDRRTLVPAQFRRITGDTCALAAVNQFVVQRPPSRVHWTPRFVGPFRNQLPLSASAAFCNTLKPFSGTQ